MIASNGEPLSTIVPVGTGGHKYLSQSHFWLCDDVFCTSKNVFVCCQYTKLTDGSELSLFLI